VTSLRELPIDFGAIVDSLRLAVFVFRDGRLVYQNLAAASLTARLRAQYRVDVRVMLREHLPSPPEAASDLDPAVTLLTAARGEPLYVHVRPIGTGSDTPDVVITVRELGIERDAFARRYRLSRREAEVAELVMRGYRNPEIATALGIARTTTKRHLTRIFQKIGVDSRTRLISRLA
jgi:DNA-binding CsgD family transcriptional regulator